MKVNKFSDICLLDDSLREYQQQAKESIFQSWDEVTSVMFQMPTGTGKTRLFTSIIRDINRYSVKTKQPVKIVVIAHRTELIDQIHNSLLRYSIPHGIIAGSQERNLKMPVQVASIQTLTNKHNIEDAKKLKADFVIIDEAHHSLAQTYKTLWKIYPFAKRLGVTATPWRMSGNGFTSLYDKLIKSWDIKEFIARNYLSGYQYYSLKSGNPVYSALEKIREFDIDGDYKVSALERFLNINKIRAQLLDSYLTLANGKKGIIYAISRYHSQLICDDFSKRGIKIAAIDSKTPKEERQRLVNDFRIGKLTIIVNVDIFSEGFDCPDIEFVQLARPTLSLAKYLQQVGRALRPTDAKTHAIILDNVGMYERFGLPDARRHWMHHFIGANQSTKLIVEHILRMGDSIGRICDLKEGNEPMVLIQQTDDVLGEEEKVSFNKEPQVGEILYNPDIKSSIWRDPKHEFRNGVHYYEDVFGKQFCLYPDKNGNWGFELVLPDDPARRKVLIKSNFGAWQRVTNFSLCCMLARAFSHDLMYIGLCNYADDEYYLMDFFALSEEYDGTSLGILKNRLYFDKEGNLFDSEDDFFDSDEFLSIQEEEDRKKQIDETIPLAKIEALIREELLGPDYVPNIEPIALLGYDIRFFKERVHVYSNLNDGTSELLFDWSVDSDFAKKVLECEKNELPYEILGVIKSGDRKYYDNIWLYTLQSTGEVETFKFLPEGGMYYTDENSLKPEFRPQPKKKKKKKNKKKQCNQPKEVEAVLPESKAQVIHEEQLEQPQKRIRKRIKVPKEKHYEPIILPKKR